MFWKETPSDERIRAAFLALWEGDEVRADMESHSVLRLIHKQEIRNFWVKAWKRVGIAVGVIAAVYLIVVACIGWSHLNDHDYAGYGPNRVDYHGSIAVSDWLFDKSHAHLLSKSHSTFDGGKAWKAVYLVNGQKVCAYVWDSQNEAVQKC